MVPNDDGDDLAAVTALMQFFRGDGLTERLASAEAALVGCSGEAGAAAAAERGLTEAMLLAALAVRSQVGRLNDVIHACTIALALPHILEPGEQIVIRPSLGAGNDPSRPFDLETDRRIAEFKVAQWKGKDAMRKRTVVSDLVHLAMDDSGRRAQLYVVGVRPLTFLRTSATTVSWALGRSSPRTRERYASTFDAQGTMSVAQFTAGPAAHVELVDLGAFLTGLAD
ncbi:MAG: PE-PGRS family protein [Mycobacterium sp.]|nr:MAG: PE-PGRS family protein [Mycobacterium sp.]